MNQIELPLDSPPRALTVSEAVRAASRMLEARFADIWIEGEVSSFKRHGSGHMYFCLRDADAQLPCALFRMEAQRLKFVPEDGLTVRCRGRLSIYESQGKFQFYVQTMEPAGLGALQLAFEQLRRKLSAEGLFDLARKRPLPRTPQLIGVVTSAHGAALRDIVRVLHRRAAVRIVVSPALVQGESAPKSIVRALAMLEAYPQIEVIIVGRGGGSSEDLAAFNDERVVRAVAGCRVPIISAVGHEVDVTLCDFAADLRAPTPSAAAELAVAVAAELSSELGTLRIRLTRSMTRAMASERIRYERLATRLDLRRVLPDRRQMLDEFSARLRSLHPRRRLAEQRATLGACRDRSWGAVRKQLDRRRHQFQALSGTLGALSPLRCLERGYAIALDGKGHALRDEAQVEPGDEVAVRLFHGRLLCMVKSKDRGST